MKLKWIFIPGMVVLAAVVMSTTYLSSPEKTRQTDVSQSEDPQADVIALQWYTDINKAHEISQATDKPIFGFFTGSDWCGWCMKLQRDVFAKQAFVEWANNNVVLLELDFPRKTKLDSVQQVQNYGLQRAFGVSGYPTIWIFNTTLNDSTNQMSITALGSLGYPSGAEVGREEVKFLETANGILAKKGN